MTTLSDLVIRTRRRVLSDLREETDTLGADILAGDTVMAIGAGQSVGSIRSGAILEIGYELVLVMNNPTGASGIEVQRGYLDTVPTAHSAGDLVSVNPRFPNADIATAVNEDIDDLSSPINGLFQVKEVTVTYNPVLVGYDLAGADPNDVMEVIEVRAFEYGPAQRWPIIPLSSVKLQRETDRAVSPSGISLKLYQAGFPGRPIRILYKAPYTTPLINPDDNVELLTGLHTQAHDIPQLGAAIRLMSFRELKRSFSESQGEPRRASEIPVGSSLTAMKGLQQLRAERISAEATRLDRIYRIQRR